MTRRFSAIIAAMLVAACSPGEGPAENVDSAGRARQLAADSIIVDTHIDVPYRLQEKWDDVTVATAGGDFDYPRARAGGLNAPFMSIYTPAALEADGTATEIADELIDLVERIVASAPEKFAIARSPADVEAHFDQGLISLPMGMENGSPIAGSMEILQHFFERGIRYITLSHSLSNHISDSSYDDNKRWGGLSEFGRGLVAEMNRLGIMIDVSHISDDAFWQVMDISGAPVIASHSSARHFTPDWERNMSDDMIKRLGDDGGVIMINFGSSFVSQAARDYGNRRSDAYDAYLTEHSLPDIDEHEEAFEADFDEANGGYPYASLEQTLDHFDHVAGLTSVDNVGIGSDYDGVGDSLPVGLKDVASYPNLVQGLLQRGYSESDIRKILGGNLLRVWREVEAVANSM